MQVIDALAFKSKTTQFQIFRMAESASVPLQLQSVALLRGGFKRFVRARGEEEKEENCKNEVTAVSGDVVKNIYEEIIASPSTPMAKRKKNTEKHETVKTEEVIALSDTDDDLEMVDTSANMELLVAVQQVGLVNLFEVDSNQTLSPRVTFLQQNEFVSAITTAPTLMAGPLLRSQLSLAMRHSSGME